MIRKKKGNIEWLEFELLTNLPGIAHGVFLRHGGISQGQCLSLNAKHKGTGDSILNVIENKRRIIDTLKIERLSSFEAAHGKNIEIVLGSSEQFFNCDGIMTRNIDEGLLSTHADCQAAIFYDPINHAIANVHAGWRGQVLNIYQATVDKMKKAFHTRPENILVGISPSLGPQHAEFTNYQTEFPHEFWEFQVKPTYFDLWAIARHQLEKCGLLPNHIEIANIDTYSHPEDFFSYRREKTASLLQENFTGCHGTVVALMRSQ